MNHIFKMLLIFSATNLIHSLKLLTSENDNWELSDEWESDIQFSYKPLLGKCKVVGKLKLIGAPDTGYDANKLGDVDCEATNGNSAADVKHYCDDVTGAKLTHYKVVWDEWVKKLKAEKKFPKYCAHIFAKLATMNNAKLKDGVMVSAFDMKIDDCTMRVFKAEGNPTIEMDSKYFCYGTAGIAWAKNDPKVKNMDGEEFEIMATGTFSLISLKDSDSKKKALEVLSFIDRAGSRCGATYIQNITIQGEWVEEVGVPKIQVRAESAVPKQKALQVNFEEGWLPAETKWKYDSVQFATAKKFILKLHKIEIIASVDSHRIYEGRSRTKRYANFLNVNFRGIMKLPKVSVGGLLGRDSHEAAAEIPEGCESSDFLSDENPKMFSQIGL